MKPEGLIAKIRANEWRCRTGILLLPAAQLEDSPNLAASLGIAAVDMAQRLASSVPAGARFLDLGILRLESLLDAIAQDEGLMDCLLLYNLDLLLAGLGTPERTLFWQDLRENFPHRPRGLICAMPAGATNLLPAVEMTKWEQAGKVATL